MNERHYGALQGLGKLETAEKHGMDQVKIWRRSYKTPPPPLERDDERFPGHDPRYADLSEADLPAGECLKDAVERFSTLLEGNDRARRPRAAKRVLIASHGNSLRALVKYLDDVSDDDIVGWNIPTGIPLVYELDDHLTPIRNYYLGDPDKVRKATAAVASQLQKKD